MVAEPHPPRWRVEDYLEMERCSTVKHEYLDGYVYAMAGGTSRHSRISVNVTSLLNSHLRSGPCRVFNSDMRVRIDARNYVYPDAAVSCDPRDLEHDDAVFLSHPRLIVEVLSDDSTADYDRGDKFNLLYARLPDLQEYVLVETGSIGVEVRRHAGDGTWPSRRFGPDDTVILESIEGRFPIGEFYR
jgi:Uma2 family endonuclease